jgi:predicted transcriptional regulator
MTDHGRRPTGALSTQVLDVLRLAERAMTVGEVQAELAGTAQKSLAYTTIETVLSRLHAHDLVDRVRVGRAYAYRAVTDRSQLTARRMRRLLDAEHDRSQVLASFVSDLSPADEDVLRRLLELSKDE